MTTFTFDTIIIFKKFDSIYLLQPLFLTITLIFIFIMNKTTLTSLMGPSMVVAHVVPKTQKRRPHLSNNLPHVLFLSSQYGACFWASSNGIIPSRRLQNKVHLFYVVRYCNCFFWGYCCKKTKTGVYL